jgi:hypothetical protein
MEEIPVIFVPVRMVMAKGGASSFRRHFRIVQRLLRTMKLLQKGCSKMVRNNRSSCQSTCSKNVGDNAAHSRLREPGRSGRQGCRQIALRLKGVSVSGSTHPPCQLAAFRDRGSRPLLRRHGEKKQFLRELCGPVASILLRMI